MGDDRLAKQALYITMDGLGRRQRSGRPQRRLSATYADLVQARVVKRQERGSDRYSDRRSTWLTLAQERATWRAYCQPPPS